MTHQCPETGLLSVVLAIGQVGMTGSNDSPIEIAANKDKKLRRRKRSSRGTRKTLAPWLAKYWQDLIVAAGAVASLLTMTGPVVGWLPAGVGLEWIGLIFLALSLAFATLRLRHHLVHNQTWWRRKGCPECGERSLKRQRRTSLDHLVGKLGIPRRRYMCAACKWRGALIDDSRLH